MLSRSRLSESPTRLFSSGATQEQITGKLKQVQSKSARHKAVQSETLLKKLRTFNTEKRTQMNMVENFKLSSTVIKKKKHTYSVNK